MTIDPADPRATDLLIPVHGRRVERIWEPRVPLPDALRKGLILEASQSEYEVCGFIDSEWTHWYVPNVHMEAEENYLMDTPSAQNTIDNIYNTLGLEILGIFHSHKNNYPWPSTRDLVGWPDPKVLDWRYFIILSDDVVEWGLA